MKTILSAVAVPAFFGICVGSSWSSAAHGATVSASGDFATTGFGNIFPPKTGSFLQTASTSAFDVSAVGAALPAPPNVGYGAFDAAASTRASYDGGGHFATGLTSSRLAFGSNNVHAASHVLYADSIANQTESPFEANFSFAIGSLTFVYNAGYVLIPSVTKVSFDARIFVGQSTVPVWSSGYFISQFGYPQYFGDTSRPYIAGLQNGVDIGLRPFSLATAPSGGAGSRQTVSTTNYVSTLALGVLQPGQSLDLRYEVDLDVEAASYGGDASVSFDDPVASLALSPSAVAAVPEVSIGSEMATGLGLLTLVGVRRRRRNR